MNSITIYKNNLKKEIDNFEFINFELEILNLYDTFDLKNPFEIMNFIKLNPNFINLLNDIKPLLNQYFPSNIYFLQYVQDIETPEFEQLFLQIEYNVEDNEWKPAIKIWKEFNQKIKSYLVKYDLIDKFTNDLI